MILIEIDSFWIRQQVTEGLHLPPHCCSWRLFDNCSRQHVFYSTVQQYIVQCTALEVKSVASASTPQYSAHCSWSTASASTQQYSACSWSTISCLRLPPALSEGKLATVGVRWRLSRGFSSHGTRRTDSSAISLCSLSRATVLSASCDVTLSKR